MGKSQNQVQPPNSHITECDSFDSLMVVVDHGSSKGIISIPCNKTIDATQTAQNYIDHVYWRFGLPDSFLSNRGPQFNSHIFKEIMRLLGVKTLRSMAYHPQTDRETECVNQELEIYFRIFCTNNPKMWKSLNPLMEFSHNQKVHSVMKQSLFYLMMGYKPKDILLAFEDTNTPAAEQRLKTLKEARSEASTAHELTRQQMAEWSTRGFTPFKKGQRVCMAWWQEPEDRIQIPKTRSKKRRVLQDNRSHGICHLLSKTSGPMVNSPCLPCLSLITLSRDQDPWSQRSAASTWPYRRRRVWSWSNHHI